MIAYPAYHGLYTWDHAYLMLEDQVKPVELYPDCEWHEAKESVIWSCRKEWIKGKLLKDYVPNEKTKIVIFRKFRLNLLGCKVTKRRLWSTCRRTSD